MKPLRVIDALLLPEVLAGSRRIALSPASQGSPSLLPPQSLGVDPQRGRLYWCDGTYHPAAEPPTYFSSEAALTLPLLHSVCTLIDTPRGDTA